jgi:hypothetical protein
VPATESSTSDHFLFPEFHIMFNSPVHILSPQFEQALGLINISDERRQFAIEAHEEIRGILEADETLCAWGISTVLIGSYARHTAIHPGKDVDIFARLTNLSVDDTSPAVIFEHVRDLLVAHYGDRAEPQNRSVKVSFDRDGFEFSVDAVPAVRLGQRWAIPRHDVDLWDDPDERWVETDPEKLTRLSSEQNKTLKIDGQGVYVPTVKLMRQTRSHHLPDQKPGGFYFELMTYWVFDTGRVNAASFAEVFAAALGAVAAELASGAVLIDPVLGSTYKPAPDPTVREHAAVVFAGLAQRAQHALRAESRCEAAKLWREILGSNCEGQCFPLPEGCDESGRALPVTAVGSSRGSREPGPFA